MTDNDDLLDGEKLYNMTGAFFPAGLGGDDVENGNLEIRFYHAERNPGLSEDVVTIDGQDSFGRDMDIVLTRESAAQIFGFVSETMDGVY